MVVAALLFILKAFWFILPGVFANMAPVLVKSVKFLDIPVDLGKTWHNKPIFGSHKTFRGFFFGTLAAILVTGLQTFLYDQFDGIRRISIIPYDQYNFLLLGFLMGFGVLFGDLVRSAIKRRCDVKPGGAFFPWDQIDAIVGGLIFLAIVYIPPWPYILFLLVFTPTLHILINWIATFLGLKKSAI